MSIMKAGGESVIMSASCGPNGDHVVAEPAVTGAMTTRSRRH
jgi:hypothetical protein